MLLSFAPGSPAVCQSQMSGKIVCQSIKAINERQRAQLFCPSALFSWTIYLKNFLFSQHFAPEKTLLFKKLLLMSF